MKAYRYVKKADKIKFSNCALDINKNLLPPLKCPCAKLPTVTLENEENMMDFCGGMLLQIACKQCGIFVIQDNGNIFIALKFGEDEDGIDMYTYTPQVGKCDYSTIGLIALGCELHLYGLLVEIEPTKFKIVEE